MKNLRIGVAMLIRIWRCRDGRRIRLCDMHDAHLNNCIAMIQRGHDAAGRKVMPRTKATLQALLVERDIRDLRKYDNRLWC